MCVATGFEADRLRARLGGDRGAIAGKSVAVLETGVGPVNAAHALARAIDEAGAVVSLGIGGAFPGAGLAVGGVACAATEEYADLGAESPEGFLDMEALGFPVAAGHYNRLPLSLFPCADRRPFVTNTTCTGTDATARALAARTGGAVESMEGAAIVHVALLHGKPVGEVRGISNLVGDRDRASWRLDAAARAAQEALLSWIEAGAC